MNLINGQYKHQPCLYNLDMATMASYGNSLPIVSVVLWPPANTTDSYNHLSPLHHTHCTIHTYSHTLHYQPLHYTHCMIIPALLTHCIITPELHTQHYHPCPALQTLNYHPWITHTLYHPYITHAMHYHPCITHTVLLTLALYSDCIITP